AHLWSAAVKRSSWPRRRIGSVSLCEMEKGNSSVCGDSEVSEIETPSGQEQQQPRPSQRIDGIPSNRGDGADDSKVDGQNIDEGSDIFISLPNMPRRFGCSRCNRCRVRSKGAFYCRAQMLHLFAPGWQEEDQTKLWQIPRGFLKWLRNEGPLEGCSAPDRLRTKPAGDHAKAKACPSSPFNP
ncbi:unnamed protein product, partial [Ascophyllum nodosum]